MPSLSRFYGNFGVFEDSLPDGYGRYLLHKTLLRKGINDSALSSLDRLAIVGDNGMGALTYSPAINLEQEENVADFDRLQQIALEVLKEQQDNDAGLIAQVQGVLLGPAGVGILSHHHLGRIRSELDEVHLPLGKRVELLSLARLHKEDDLLVGNLIGLTTHQVSLHGGEIEIHDPQGRLIVDFRQFVLCAHSISSFIFC